MWGSARALGMKHISPQRPGRSAGATTTASWIRQRHSPQGTTLFPEPRPTRSKTLHRRAAFKNDRSDLVEFLREDLDHLFDDQGIDVRAYDDRVLFRDPITSYNTIQGYVSNIKFLRTIFRPKFTLHNIKQTGEDEISFRWTMDMVVAGIDRELVFTGTSKLGVNPRTNRFCSHIDTWDAVRNQEYFSLEAFVHMLGQLTVQRSEALRGEVLLKRDAYEVVQRDGRVVAVPVGGDAPGSPWKAALDRDGLQFRVASDGAVVLDEFAFPPL